MPKKSPSTKPPAVDDAYIQAIIDKLPPLTDEACERIAALLLCGGEKG